MAAEVYHDGEQITLASGETVLDGLLRGGRRAKYSCRAGSCHTCMMRAASGEPGAEAQKGLPSDLVKRGYFLPCKCRPSHALSIEKPDPLDLLSDAMVAEKRIVAPDVCVLSLEASPDLRPRPGQYITVMHPDGEGRPYSVASRPEQDYFFDLHVRRIAGGKVSGWLFDEVDAGDVIKLQPPAGSFVNRDPEPGQKLLLIGTGTGLAPLLPLLHESLDRGDAGEIWLVHGGRHPSDLYADQELRELSGKHELFQYVPCLSGGETPEHGHQGRVTDWLAGFPGRLEDYRIFAAGNPDMIASLYETVQQRPGSQHVQIVTDAFEFAHSRIESGNEAGDSSKVRKAPAPDPELWAALDDGRILRDVLHEFYALAFEDERLGPYFAGVTQQRLREKQYNFLRSLILGTRDYLGQRPKNAHHWMVISDELFDYRLSLMETCMRKHGLDERWIRRWHVFEEFFRGDIVKSQPAPRTVGGQVVPQWGIEDTVLEVGALCDRCQNAIDAGEIARFHLDQGKIFCRECSA